MSIRQRLPAIAQMCQEDLPLLRANASDFSKDRDGCSSSVLRQNLRFLGIADFILNNEIDSFRQHLVEGVHIKLSMFERFDAGEPIDGSYVTMLAYKELFDALAAGEIRLAKSLASRMGGRPELEKKHDHPFDRCLGYALRALVQGHSDAARHVADFSAICQEPDNADFRGYALVFEAILSKNVALGEEGLKQIVKGHKNQGKRGGVFNNTEDEVLCVWGIGAANLARFHGLALTAVPPLVPDELLIPI